MNEKRLKDLAHLTHFDRSGSLEVLDALFNVYCPKCYSCSYNGMYARTQLAVMDHNCGTGRDQAVRAENFDLIQSIRKFRDHGL